MNNQTTLHETILKDVMDFLDDIKDSDILKFAKNVKANDFKSISSKTAGLTLVFPVITSPNTNIKTATMVAKAQERQAVSMLQLFFSAVNISGAKDGFDFIKQFHNNLDSSGSISVDTFINTMDKISTYKENAFVTEAGLQKIKQDMRNLNFYFESNYSNKSLGRYYVTNRANTPRVIYENDYRANPTGYPSPGDFGLGYDQRTGTFYDPSGNYEDDYYSRVNNFVSNYNKADQLFNDKAKATATYSDSNDDREQRNAQAGRQLGATIRHNREMENLQRQQQAYNRAKDAAAAEYQAGRDATKDQQWQAGQDQNQRQFDDNLNYRKGRDNTLDSQYAQDSEQRKRMNDEQIRNNRFNNKLAQNRDDREEEETIRKANRDRFNDKRDRLMHQLVDNDVKKANELIPTIMVVNFNQVIQPNPNVAPMIVPAQVLIGVKAKIYSVDSGEIINRIIAKNRDSHGLLNLIKATTRETSFLRDLLFGIDRAKIDAMASSKKGSTAKIFKILERRANKSKFKRSTAQMNDAAAISTIHITREEVDMIKKIDNFDLTKAENARKILDAYNLMSFVYSDESSESVSFIYDTGEDFYETMSFDGLERESNDNSAKKVINLMTKMSR